MNVAIIVGMPTKNPWIMPRIVSGIVAHAACARVKMGCNVLTMGIAPK